MEPFEPRLDPPLLSLMYTVELIVDALVVVGTPESILVNTEVKNTHKWCLYLNGIAVVHGNSAFLRDKPITTTLIKSHVAISCNNECAWAKENFGAGG